MKNFYITTPIYYVNDSPHIGHAYTSLCCDYIARFKKLDGFNVKFLTGTDEHGQKVENAANAKKIEPKEFVDEVSKNFLKLTDILNLSNSDFIRTTEQRHINSCEYLWKKLYSEGHIYLDKYSGWYSVRDEAYFQESELINGKAPTGADVEWVEEPSYFFNLSNWQDKLLAFYKNNPEFILPKSRKNEVLNFVKSGLKDLSISRTSFSWGIKVPNDPKHIMYVWLDALTNYITYSGYGANEKEFKNNWPADLHVVGKDILRFHAVYWPAFLMAADLPLPKRVFAHGWWTNEGEKISKSLGNVIDPFKLIEQYGLDQVRYFLLREVPFGNDGDFSRSHLVQRINSELANNLGNLVQRVVSFCLKNTMGKVPDHKNEFKKEDLEIIESFETEISSLRNLMDQQKLDESLKEIWIKISKSNKYIDEQAPWNLKNDNAARMNVVLYCLLESIRQIGILIQPIMPSTANKILDIFGLDTSQRFFNKLGSKLLVGTDLIKQDVMFPRIENQ